MAVRICPWMGGMPRCQGWQGAVTYMDADKRCDDTEAGKDDVSSKRTRYCNTWKDDELLLINMNQRPTWQEKAA